MDPTPTPSTTTAVVNVTLSNYWLATGIVIATVVVIALALAFMWIYHRRALRTLEVLASTPGAPPIGVMSQDAYGSQFTQQPKVIVGSVDGQKGVGLMYVIKDVDDGDAVTWDIPDADVEVVSNSAVIAKFKKDGTHTVNAKVVDAAGTDLPVQPMTVTIKPQTVAAPGVVIPFVLKNWGRLVVVLFGAGVVAALMATKILDSAAGIGVLGVLLGAGVASTATGGGAAETAATKPAQQRQNNAAEDD